MSVARCATGGRGGQRHDRTLSELTCLHLHRPPVDAAPTVLARYFAALALVHEHLAEDATTPAERARELDLAARNRRRATHPTIPIGGLTDA